MLKVYAASSLHSVLALQDLEREWREVEFVSSWIHADLSGSVDPSRGRHIWTVDHADVTKADVVMVWSATLNPLRGAIFEAGLAVAQGKPVIVVGEHPSYSNWQYHPAIYRAVNLAAARGVLALLEVTPKTEWCNAPLQSIQIVA